MVQAYSQLKRVLSKRQITIPELHRLLKQSGMQVNVKSLYRLNQEHQPVERLDLRVAGAICQICKVPLSDLVTFETVKRRLQRFSTVKQRRLDVLMSKNTEGTLTRTEAEELRALVREAEEMTLANARVLAKQKQRLAA
jgi:hypothetical protein